jgi:glutamate carboxypeptidase
MPHRDLLDHLAPRRDAMLAALEELVVRESPSRDKVALDALAGYLAGRLGGHGLDVHRLANDAGGDHLRLRLGGPAGEPPALVLCHFDTVWPTGTVDRLPFRVADGRAFGPGVYDMKASLVLCEFAVAALAALGRKPPRPVVFVFTSDEEIGSPTSRRLIEDEARSSAYALVLEPPLPGGRLKTSRKGVGRFTLEITGKAAHAGVEPEKGVSALVELAHQILAVGALADRANGTTLNVGTARGGTTGNVVPASATAEVDARAATMDEARRVEAAMAGLRPVLPGASVTVRGGFNRPPMERTAQTVALFERARAVGRTLGLDLGEGSSGGGSDGNFTAALGLPTLDGLGTPGDGAHADHEHVQIDALPVRAALLAALLLEL